MLAARDLFLNARGDQPLEVITEYFSTCAECLCHHEENTASPTPFGSGGRVSMAEGTDFQEPLILETKHTGARARAPPATNSIPDATILNMISLKVNFTAFNRIPFQESMAKPSFLEANCEYNLPTFLTNPNYQRSTKYLSLCASQLKQLVPMGTV